MLICPKCKEQLIKEENNYQCVNHHVFDIARRGYVNMLLGNHKITGDDKEMVKARTDFLSHGYYQPLCDAIKAIIIAHHPNMIVDAGCGEGFYTNQIKEALPTSIMYGFDISKFAVDEACKGKKDIIYGVCSVFHMPLHDACADMIISIFAPFDSGENKRVLKTGGLFIKVSPASKHLLAMKQVLYDNVYENEECIEQYEGMERIHEECIDYEIQITGQKDIHALFQMTPYYWRTPKAGSERLSKLDALQTRVQFRLEVFKKL